MFIDLQKRLWLLWPTILDNHWESALMRYLISSDYQKAGPPRWGRKRGPARDPGHKLPEGQQRLRVANSIPQGFLFDSSSYTTGLTRAQVNGGNWQVSVYGASAKAYAAAAGAITAPAGTNVWQVHTFVVTTNSSAPNFRHYINGTQVGLVTNSIAGALGGFIMGVNASAAVGIRADVAELFVFDSALDDATRSNIESNLAAKWTGVIADTNAPTPPVNQFVRVFSAGVDRYTCFRIPAIVTTTNGTVIAMADGRIGSCGDIPTPLDLVCKRSFDNGLTWGPLQVIADYGSNPNDVDTYPYYGATNISRVSAGDSALLVDRTNGRVWTLYDNGGVLSGSRKIKLELRYSDDDGATWSAAIDLETLNPGLRPVAPEFLAGPGNGIQLSSDIYAGRLIFPVYAYGSPYYSTMIYSDDHGATWHLGGVAGTGGGEVQTAETPDGGLIASMRDNAFSWSGVRTFSRSSDGGLTWGALFTNTTNPPSIPDPACQGNIYRLTTTNDSNASRLIHANAASASSRVNMTLRISYDEGATWAVSNQVYAGGSAYSSVTKLATGEVGLLFEKDPYGSLDYIRRSVSQITGGADSLPPYTVWAGNCFSPAQLMKSSISGPEADPDDDGFNNQSEFTAGTDPLNAANSLKLNLSPTSTNAMLHFEGVSNKSYTVQFWDELVAGSWQRFADVTTLPSNSTVAIPVAATNATRFFRLATPQLP
jgi:sialidase-1